MQWLAFLAVVAVAECQTMLRFGCSQIVIDRIDPLVNPDQLPSTHMHQVVGGDAFNVSMPSTDMLLFNDKFTTQTSGGFVVYYVSPGKGKVTAFKPGFRMLVGDAAQRTKKGSGLKSQTCFRCYSGPNFGGDNAAPCADAKCWDGKNLDSPDHKSHVAYPSNGPATFTGSSTGGNCPATHPVKIPQIMLEIVWDTSKFNNKAEWPADGSQPFVLSTGDNTGYGQHGDYVFGWKGDSLQKAMDTNGCMGASCASLPAQAVDNANKCKVPTRYPENYDGCK
ncbi:hypothetical protein M7I_1875 [Glarea lozoyensis 74030]|uniref:DUF1996 domain-containing protein n=1 Tax=Glarea lozoyensis (strain ATCC 74030 / MF5533) TaxID=1104152 RepID=H0EH98_GLAL7|nr:hypothetical protein M7I_1875 [Glarea lozoyensis 74030]